jgi:hypothetical protein
MRWRVTERLTVEPDLAARLEPGDGTQQRGLARAVGPDDGRDALEPSQRYVELQLTAAQRHPQVEAHRCVHRPRSATSTTTATASSSIASAVAASGSSSSWR